MRRKKGTPEFVYARSREEAQRLLDESYLQKFAVVPVLEYADLRAEAQRLQEALLDLDALTFENEDDEKCVRAVIAAALAHHLPEGPKKG